jgi:ketosteroid isomerase-like protein
MPTQDWWRGLFAAIDARDADGFVAHLTDDAEFRFANHPPAHGRAAIRAVVDGFFGTIGGCRHRLIRTWEDGADVVCQGEVTYTRLDGAAVTVPFVNVFEMRGERVARYLIYNDVTPVYAPAA